MGGPGWGDSTRAHHPRDAGTAGDTEGTVTLLLEDDQAYLEAGATTEQDLASLAPRVEPAVAQQVMDTDPTLDEDLGARWDPEVRVPRLSLLGAVKAKTWGKPMADRRRTSEWLGKDTAGQLHLPYAQDAPAAQLRGVNVYQVTGLLVDVDLFRRLRTRAEARVGKEVNESVDRCS